MAAKLCLVVLVYFSFLSASAVQGKQGKTWALLVSSASGWRNYGLQADVYHAFHAIKEGGIPDEQIIVMAYDDIAQNSNNPFKGQVFHSYDLKDIYKGITIDYSGHAVTKETFLAVLQGDKHGVKRLTGQWNKVIDSGPDDNVFVFISDHGGAGIILWPDGNDLTAKELNHAILSMHHNNSYNNMVIYVDTCYAGSMFEDILPANIGVYAVTSSNASSPSYMTDCFSIYFTQPMVCLGSHFSINWIYETSSDDRTDSTLDQQFLEATIACKGFSIPKRYGNITIAKNLQATFFGDSALNTKTSRPEESHRRRLRRSAKVNHSVPKHMQAYYLLRNRLAHLPLKSGEYLRVSGKVKKFESMMRQAEQFMRAIPNAVYGHYHTDEQLMKLKNNFGEISWDCYEPVLKAVRGQCPGVSRREEIRYYIPSWFGVLVNLCKEVSTRRVLAAVKEAARLSPVCRI